MANLNALRGKAVFLGYWLCIALLSMYVTTLKQEKDTNICGVLKGFIFLFVYLVGFGF